MDKATARSAFFTIAPAVGDVTIGGTKVPFKGVTLSEVVILLAQFPELYQLFNRPTDENGDTLPIQITPDIIYSVAPRSVASIIAAGGGYINDKEAIELAQSWPLGTQVACLAKIIELSWPDGFGPFVQQLENLAAMADGLPGVNKMKQTLKKKRSTTKLPEVSNS